MTERFVVMLWTTRFGAGGRSRRYLCGLTSARFLLFGKLSFANCSQDPAGRKLKSGAICNEIRTKGIGHD